MFQQRSKGPAGHSPKKAKRTVDMAAGACSRHCFTQHRRSLQQRVLNAGKL